MSSAVDVMILLVEPGATRAVSAKSLSPSLFATARMSPVVGWMITIELSAWSATADSAAASAVGLNVVLTTPVFTGLLSWSVVFAIGWPFAPCSSISTPGVPWPVGALFSSALAMLRTPGSVAPDRSLPAESVTSDAAGGTSTLTIFSPAVRFGATSAGFHSIHQPPFFS